MSGAQSSDDSPSISRLEPGQLSPHHRPRPLPPSSKHTAPAILQNLVPSNSASPPTPAPSPTPQGPPTWWNDAAEDEHAFLRDTRYHFSRLGRPERQRFLAEVLNLCDSRQLSFVHSFVSPRLKKDPFSVLPNELCLRVLSFVDDAKSLARASQVSRLWRDLLGDEMAWKLLYEKHAYRRISNAALTPPHFPSSIEAVRADVTVKSASPSLAPRPQTRRELEASSWHLLEDGRDDRATRSLDGTSSPTDQRPRPLTMSYKAQFKQHYMVETAWRHGGRVVSNHIQPDQGVVTGLHLTSKYIIVALDNAKIHVFDTDGAHQKTLIGHVMGVWAMVPRGDTLVSGGCDRDVRVWDMSTGESIFVLRGHTSTVRCLKMSDNGYAISGSRDTMLRVWDIKTGTCRSVLMGHQASVRCLEISGDLVVSGSYDTTAKIWSISEGRCLRTLVGHFSQIYAIAFDGNRIATGSLDTSVRIWDPRNGQCLGTLQGHTSLVGHLQMRDNTLVTGGSDGSVRVWCLRKMVPFHRLAAHDNSVTSLQFDAVRVVSGGCDGRVKVWDLKTGLLVRELGAPADAVWRVAFEDEKAVIMASRAGRTIMEVWSFSPPEEDDVLGDRRPTSLTSDREDGSTGDEDGDMKMTDATDARDDASEATEIEGSIPSSDLSWHHQESQETGTRAGFKSLVN